MLVKIEARILIFPGTDFHFPSTSVPPGTFLGSAVECYSSWGRCMSAGLLVLVLATLSCESVRQIALQRSLGF